MMPTEDQLSTGLDMCQSWVITDNKSFKLSFQVAGRFGDGVIVDISTQRSIIKRYRGGYTAVASNLTPAPC